MDWHRYLAEQLRQAESRYLGRRRKLLDSPQGRTVKVEGKLLTNFCSNDYLGFAKHPKIAEAVASAAKDWGVGSGSSHLVCGHQRINQDFENRFAGFVGAESALLFSTGYMANFAVLNSFFDRQGVILQDKLNHASLLDAGRLSRSEFSRYKHMDMVDLQGKLKLAVDKTNQDRKPVILATDAVFSMDGCIAPLKELSDLAQANGVLAYFDDAHGFGVLGDLGKGSLNSQNISPSGNNLMLSTMGKALGSFGAVVSGDKVFIDSLIQNARPYIYTTALPPTVVAANQAALSLLESGDGALPRLHSNIQYFRQGIESVGLNLMNSATAIQPILLGDNEIALHWSLKLRDMGFLVVAIRPPTVPAGSARLRITLSATHTREDIDRLVYALAELQSSDNYEDRLGSK